MQADDILLEVRDKDFRRLGTIRGVDLNGVFRPAMNAAGDWEVTLPAGHPMARHLRRPGSGIIMSVDGEVILSGPTTEPKTAWGIGDIGGTCTFTGVTDTIHLSDRLAYADPSTGYASIAAKTEDVRTGRPDDVMVGYVLANMGGGSPASRRIAGLTAHSTSAKAMGTITKAGRMQRINELLDEIADPHSLAYDIVQQGDHLVFRVWDIRDRTRHIRMDVDNGMLASAETMKTPPEVTHIIVAGKGEISNRRVLEVSTPASVAAGAAWGRRIEDFIDDPNTEDETELRQSAAADLHTGGKTEVTSKAVPVEDAGMRFNKTWRVGDLVTVTLDGEEEPSLITGAVIMANASGVRVGAQVGAVRRFNKTKADGMEKLARNVSRIARSTYSSGGGGGGGGAKVQYAFIAPDPIYTESGLVRLIMEGETKHNGTTATFMKSYKPAAGDYVVVLDGIILGRAIGGPYDNGHWTEPLPPQGRLEDADPSRWGELTVTKTTTGWVLITGYLKFPERKSGDYTRHLFTLPGDMRPATPNTIMFMSGGGNINNVTIKADGSVGTEFDYSSYEYTAPIAMAFNNNKDGLTGNAGGAWGVDAYGLVYGTGYMERQSRTPRRADFTGYRNIARTTDWYGTLALENYEHNDYSATNSAGWIEEARFNAADHTMEYQDVHLINGWQAPADSYSTGERPRVALRRDGLATISGATSNGLIGVPAFTLPEGMRPKYELVYAWGRITPGGDVYPTIASCEFMHPLWIADH